MYKDMLTPVVDEVLLLKREPDNVRDNCAVTVLKEGQVVGHIPYNISAMVSHFVSRDCNKAFVEVTGDRVNWEQNMALKCCAVTAFMAQNYNVKRMKELLHHERHKD